MEDEEDLPQAHEALDGAVQSVAEAYPAPDHNDADQNEDEVEEEQTFIANRPVAADVPEDVPEVPVAFVPNKNKKTPVQLDEEADDDDEEDLPVRTRNRAPAGATYFPVTFGSTNGGAIAIANSYSTGKGETGF